MTKLKFYKKQGRTTHTFNKLKNSYHILILCLFVFVFIILKFSCLHAPFFWDEAWVYAPAVREMANNGISLMPGALSDTYSRGHPLLFFAAGATWVKLFGSSLFSMHLFAFAIAISFIFTLFYIVKNMFADSTLALIVSSLTLVQHIFVAQSALVLPEIFLALWAILTIYHFVRQNKFYYILFGTFLVLTKETGVVIIASLMLYQAICFFTDKISLQSFKLFLKNTLLVFLPIIPFLVFLWIQHNQRGYYFFPEHISLLNFNWHDFKEHLKGCYDYLFERQDRIYIMYSFLILFALFYKPIPIILRILIVVGLFACVKIFFQYWALPEWVMIIYIGLFTSAFYYVMHIKYTAASKQPASLLAVLFLTSILYLVFSSVNFLTARYLLLSIPLMIVYFSYYIKESLRFYMFLPYTWLVLIMSVFVYGIFYYYSGLGDDSPQYIQAVNLEKNIIDYLEQQHLQKDTFDCAFTMNVALKHAEVGFLPADSTFKNVTGKLNQHTKYVVFTNIDYDSLWLKGSDTLPHFKIIKKFDCGIANGKVFERVSPQ